MGLRLGVISLLWNSLSSGLPLEVHMTSNPTPGQTGDVSLGFQGDRTEEDTKGGGDSLWIGLKYMRGREMPMKVELCLFGSPPYIQ